ncbi:hypothetical protein BCON_0116g00290 [Botryotinia convoluta]|uniref:Uncharacterized protein n=1 Tax=Botryotinia convoluta TaxID=54673 RepID=A0A4Z1HXX6_9HELO|nr:hypothetical protein BCON_0116g00290 [Botryotinia convoluta]
MFENNVNHQGGCFNCTKRELEIEYLFDGDEVLKRMVTDVTPVDKLKPRLWDPKFHHHFMAARDKQSPPMFNKYTSSDEEYVSRPTVPRRSTLIKNIA